jgi:hypothetical protein
MLMTKKGTAPPHSEPAALGWKMVSACLAPKWCRHAHHGAVILVTKCVTTADYEEVKGTVLRVVIHPDLQHLAQKWFRHPHQGAVIVMNDNGAIGTEMISTESPAKPRNTQRNKHSEKVCDNC